MPCFMHAVLVLFQHEAERLGLSHNMLKAAGVPRPRLPLCDPKTDPIFRYVEEGSTEQGPTYQLRIIEMVKNNKQSLEVDFIHLSRHETALAIWTVDAPTQMLRLFDDEARESLAEKFPKYLQNVHADIFVRMTGLPVVEHLRDIRCVLSPQQSHKLYAFVSRALPSCLDISMAQQNTLEPCLYSSSPAIFRVSDLRSSFRPPRQERKSLSATKHAVPPLP
jgi:hypothetical protein